MREIFARLVQAVAACMFVTTSVSAADVEIRMLNKGADGAMVFEPAFVKVQPGDTVTFVPTDKGHYVESLKGLTPEGAETLKSRMNETYKVTLTVPGAYGFACPPHYAMGMVGLIVVGNDAANIESVKTAKLPRKAQERMSAALAAAGS